MESPALTCPSCEGKVRMVPDGHGMLACPECQTLVANPDATTGGPATASADLLTPSHSSIRKRPLPEAASTVSTPFSGAFLNQYHVVGVLGQGAVGTVYLMNQVKLSRLVAVKVVRGELTYEETRRLLREARLLASVNHPCIVALHDVGTDGTIPYMVCEYVEGETLADRMERKPPLTVSQAVRISMHILDGLKAAHKAGIIHRDLKPGNIFLSLEGRPKIGDFGQAKSQAAPSGSMSGRIQGTPPYMSPEQCRGRGISQASDLYALGCILFEMLTGQKAFVGPTILDYLTQHDSVPPPRLRALKPELPEALEAIVQRALEKLPDRRYRSASQMRKDLLDVYRGSAAVTVEDAPPPPGRAPALSAEPGVILCQRYELVRLLGQGGMGQVWLARDRVMDGAEVAVKILPPELWRDVEAQTNLKHEAKLSQKLAHPNVVRLMTLEPGDAPVLVMEYVPGKTMAHHIIRRKSEARPFTPEEVWPLVDGLASALDHAHQKGLVHRDIKPSNVLLEPRTDGGFTAKLADFGIASEVTAFRTRQTGMVPVGTLAYMSPEQVACRKIDARSDVYALAATIYQALTFDPPFSGPDLSQQIQSREPPMPPSLAPRMARCLSRALAKKADDRYTTAGEFAMAFYQATAIATSPGAPVLGTQESLSYVGRATRRGVRAVGGGEAGAGGGAEGAGGAGGQGPGGWEPSTPQPGITPPAPLNPNDPRLYGVAPAGPASWTSMVFAIGVLLMGVAALVYVINGPPQEAHPVPSSSTSRR